jgi:hypothetical protein
METGTGRKDPGHPAKRKIWHIGSVSHDIDQKKRVYEAGREAGMDYLDEDEALLWRRGMHRGIRAVILTCTCMHGAGRVQSDAKADAQFTAAGSALTILQATDLHYLSPALQDGGTACYEHDGTMGTARMTEYSREILDALTSSVIAEHPAAFLLSGDITFNGERQSLEEVRDALRTDRSFRGPGAGDSGQS